MGGPHLNLKKSQGKCFWSDGRTVGQGQSQGKFFLVGRSGGGRRTDGSFYFALEPPIFNKSKTFPNFIGGGGVVVAIFKELYFGYFFEV